jgi:branched-subunit amino acid transport protein
MSLDNPQLWGGLASILGFLATKSMVFTIISGMIIYTGARFI